MVEVLKSNVKVLVPLTREVAKITEKKIYIDMRGLEL